MFEKRCEHIMSLYASYKNNELSFYQFKCVMKDKYNIDVDLKILDSSNTFIEFIKKRCFNKNLLKPSLKRELYNFFDFVNRCKYDLSKEHRYYIGVLFITQKLYRFEIVEDELWAIINKYYYNKNVMIHKILDITR